MLAQLEYVHEVDPLNARPRNSFLGFPPNTDIIHIHKWWLFDIYYKRVYANWINGTMEAGQAMLHR